jgi:hypothetical protein
MSQKQLDLIDLPVALALWERLDEYERGYITHKDFWVKMADQPDIAEKLGLLKLLSEEDVDESIQSIFDSRIRCARVCLTPTQRILDLCIYHCLSIRTQILREGLNVAIYTILRERLNVAIAKRASTC